MKFALYILVIMSAAVAGYGHPFNWTYIALLILSIFAGFGVVVLEERIR